MPRGWKVVRSLLVASGVASSLLAGGARDAVAAEHYGMIPPHNGQALPHRIEDPTQCGEATYCGGPVISNVQVQPVFWTSQVSSTITSFVPTYLQTIVSSTFVDMLSEYSTSGKMGVACGEEADGGEEYFGPPVAQTTNQLITRGSYLAPVTITPMVSTGASITDDDAAIGAEIVAQIQAGKLPAPTYDAQGYPNTLYFVFFPSDFQISLQGGQSCQDFGGYHMSGSYDGQVSCTGQYIPYAVIPDCQDSQDDFVAAVSHELAEAITDTDVGPTVANPNDGDGAWYLGPTAPCPDPNNCPMDCGEIGDVCQQAGNATIVGTTIAGQEMWSQEQGGCAISNPAIGAQTDPAGTPRTTCASVTPTPDAGTTTDASTGSDATTQGSDSGGIVSPDDASPLPGTDSGYAPSYDSGGGGGVTPHDAGENVQQGTGSAKSGCSCTMMGSTAVPNGLGALGALVGLALIRRRRSSRPAVA